MVQYGARVVMLLSVFRRVPYYSPSSGEFRNFTDIDGIQSNQFTSYAYCKGKDGQMYFGGVNGITVFNPAVFPENPYIPSVVITELSVLNRQVRPGDVTGILSRHISETKQIELPAGQSTFSYRLNYLPDSLLFHCSSRWPIIFRACTTSLLTGWRDMKRSGYIPTT